MIINIFEQLTMNTGARIVSSTITFLLMFLVVLFLQAVSPSTACAENTESPAISRLGEAPVTPDNLTDTYDFALDESISGKGYYYDFFANGFYSFDLPDLSTAVLKGTFDRSVYAMDTDPSGSTVYALDNLQKQLGTIDKATGAYTPVAGLSGLINGQTITGLTVDPNTTTYLCQCYERLYCHLIHSGYR